MEGRNYSVRYYPALYQCCLVGLRRNHLARIGWIQQLAESFLKIIPPLSFDRERQAVFLCLAELAKVDLWYSRLKKLKIDTFIFGQVLTNFFKVKGEREVLHPSTFFFERRVNVTRTIPVIWTYSMPAPVD